MEKLDGETLLEDTSGLIHSHITTRSELYEAEFLNIAQATEYYLFNPSRLKLTRQGLLEVHKKMFEQVWDWAGKIRKSEKNIGIPHYKIEEEIHKFLGDYNIWIKEGFDTVEIASRTHHKLVWIHPFEGGNGRWSRLVSNIIFYKGTGKLFKWTEDEIQLKKKSSFRERYLIALKEADSGNFSNLIKIHKELIS